MGVAEMPQGGSQYRRLAAAFQRILGVTIFFGTETQRNAPPLSIVSGSAS